MKMCKNRNKLSAYIERQQRYVKVGNLLLSAINCLDTVHIQSNTTMGDRALSKLERTYRK